MTFRFQTLGAGDMVQQLRLVAALAKGLNRFPARTWQLTAIFNSSSMGFAAIF